MRPLSVARQIHLSEGHLDRAFWLKQRELAQLQEQLSTGLRVNRASDDAPSFALARRMDVLEHRYDQYQESITQARGWVDHTQDALDGLAELFTQIYEEGINGLNDTLGDEEKALVADTIDALFEEALALLNSEHDDEYIFAGTLTQAEPFSVDDTTVPRSVIYAGNGDDVTRAIGPNSRLGINVPGSDLLDTGQGFTIAEAIINLSDAFRGGDSATMQVALDDLLVAQEHVLAQASDAGLVANRLDLVETQLSAAKLRVEEQRSVAQDADFAEVATEIALAQTSYEATLQMLATVNQTTLLNYL